MSDVDTLERPNTPAATSEALSVDRDALLAAIRAVNAVIENRQTIMILSNLRLVAKDGWLRVIGTDLDTWFDTGIVCFGMDLDTTVKADRLIGAIETMRPGMISVAAEPGNLVLKQGRSSRKLPTLPSVDYPNIIAEVAAVTFDMHALRLSLMLDTARVAMSTEETRYYLCGVHLHAQERSLIAAATDGHRVMQVKAGLPDGAAGMPDIIISAKGVKLLCQLIADSKPDDIINIKVTKSKFIVTSKHSTLSAKLVDGTFPDYQRILPSGGDCELDVHSAEFERCVRAAGAASDGKTRGVRLDLSADHCEASGYAQDGGRAVEPIEADYSGDPVTIGINFHYAMSVARAFGTAAKLKLAMSGPGTIILITSADRPGVVSGIMPMRA